jgi:hypothetical protein
MKPLLILGIFGCCIVSALLSLYFLLPLACGCYLLIAEIVDPSTKKKPKGKPEMYRDWHTSLREAYFDDKISSVEFALCHDLVMGNKELEDASDERRDWRQFLDNDLAWPKRIDLHEAPKRSLYNDLLMMSPYKDRDAAVNAATASRLGNHLSYEQIRYVNRHLPVCRRCGESAELVGYDPGYADGSALWFRCCCNSDRLYVSLERDWHKSGYWMEAYYSVVWEWNGRYDISSWIRVPPNSWPTAMS